MRRRRFSSSGFTMLELVLVMLILCTVFALAAPSLNGFWRGTRIKDAASQIIALTRLARTQAISESAVYRLNVDPNGTYYFLTVQQAEGFARIGTELGHEFAMPPDSRIDMTRADGQAPDHIDFFPNGRTEPTVIRISAT